MPAGVLGTIVAVALPPFELTPKPSLPLTALPPTRLLGGLGGIRRLEMSAFLPSAFSGLLRQ